VALVWRITGVEWEVWPRILKGDKGRLGHSFKLEADSTLLFWSAERVDCCPTQLSIIVLTN